MSQSHAARDANASAGARREGFGLGRDLLALCLLALALGLVYNAVILPGYGPDEPRHFRYVQLLWEERRFPFLSPGGGEYRGAHSLHPPLPYILMLPLYGLARFLPEAGQYHVLRLFSLALNLAALPLLFQVALAASRGHARARSIALGTLAVFALTPMFGMVSGVVNNDASSVFAVALFVWLLAVRFEDDLTPRRAALLGLCMGLGMLCKATVALCDGAALLAFLGVRYGWKSPSAWRTLAIAGVVAFVVALPWYARSYALYGSFSPIESGYTNPALPNPSQGILVMTLHDNFPLLFAWANWGIFYTLWSQKDWFPETVRTPIYAVYAVAFFASVAAAIRSRRASGKDEQHEGSEDSHARAVRAALYASLALNWAACVGMAVWKHWGWAEGGRYLVAALPALTFFLSRHGHRLLARPLVLPRLAVAWGVALNVVSVYWLLSYLNPTFGPR